MPSKADDFHKGLVKIISDNYTKPKSNGEWAVADAQQQQGLDRLKNSIDAWKREDWPDSNGNADPFQDPYKKEILDHTAELLKAFKDYVSHSPIFPEQEKPSNRQFQSIMEIMEVPNNPQIIGQESNMNGLFYRDMVHNPNYWEATGSHIQVMRDLCDHMAKLTDISLSDNLDVEQREKASLALGTIFTSKRDSYGKCKGGHSERINEANDVIAGTPEEMLLARWNDYGKALMMENLSQNNQRPFGVDEAYESHVQPFLNYVAGTSKDLVGIKDDYFQDISANMEYNYHSILADKVFAFPAFLADYHQNDIDTKLESFDKVPEKKGKTTTEEEALNGHRYYLIKQLWDSNLKPYLDSNLDKSGHQQEFMGNCVDEDYQVLNVSDIRDKVKEEFASLSCKVMGVSPMSFEELSALNVSPEKRLESIQENVHALSGLFLKYAADGNRDAVKGILNDVGNPRLLKNAMTFSLYCAAAQKEEKSIKFLMDSFPFIQQMGFLHSVILMAAQDQNKEALQILTHTSPKEHIPVLLGATLGILATSGGVNAEIEQALIRDACPEEQRTEMLGAAICDLVGRNAYLPLRQMMDNWSDSDKRAALGSALFQNAEMGHVQMFQMVLENCPSKERAKILGDVITQSFAKENEQAFETTIKSVPDALKVAMFGNALWETIQNDGPQLNRIITLIGRSVKNLGPRENVLGQTLYRAAAEQNKEAIAFLVKLGDQSKTEPNKIFGKALSNAAQENDTTAMVWLVDQCPKNQVEKAFEKAVSDCANNKDLNDQQAGRALGLLWDTCPRPLKQNAFGIALSLSANNREPEATDRIKNTLPSANLPEVFGTALYEAGVNNAEDALAVLTSTCPTEAHSSMFDTAKAHCRKSSENGVEKALVAMQKNLFKTAMFTTSNAAQRPSLHRQNSEVQSKQKNTSKTRRASM